VKHAFSIVNVKARLANGAAVSIVSGEVEDPIDRYEHPTLSDIERSLTLLP